MPSSDVKDLVCFYISDFHFFSIRPSFSRLYVCLITCHSFFITFCFAPQLVLVTFLFGGLFLDGLGGVDPARGARVVRVLDPEVVRLHDVEVRVHAVHQVPAQARALNS